MPPGSRADVTRNGATALNVRDAAALYISLGWYPVPLDPFTKACRDSEWKGHPYKPEEFRESDNLGIVTVGTENKRAVKLVAVDLDAQEAVAIAQEFLPPTDAAWGRKSKKVSQLLYLSPFAKSHTVTNEVGEHVVQIRADGLQSMAPPSVWVHKEDRERRTQEQLKWLRGWDHVRAAEADPEELTRAVNLLGTCALIIQKYANPHARHEWGMALAGTLRRLKITEDEAIKLLTLAAREAGDPKIEDRLSDLRSTYRKMDDEPLASYTKLAEASGIEFVKCLRRIWGDGEGFVKSKSGAINPGSQHNVRLALEEMQVKLSFDQFAQKYVIQIGSGPEEKISNSTLRTVRLRIDTRFGFLPTKELFEDVLLDTADQRKHHPVLDYLRGLKWDGTERINDWLVTYGKAKDHELTRAIGSIVLIAAVRRVETPGIKFDELLILESSQGKNKSSALRSLCPDDRWFGDDLPLNVNADKVIEATAGKWIIEAAELSGMRRTHVEHLKSFLSRQVDGPVRLAWERVAEEKPRQFVIVGTTNAKEYLKDEDNRRFWPVRVGLFDLAGIRRDRDQLWAEAWSRRSESIRLDARYWSEAQREQEGRRSVDPWEEKLAERYKGNAPLRVPLDAIWEILGIVLEKRNREYGERVSFIMQKLGCEKRLIREGNSVFRGWWRGEDTIE